MEIMNLCLSVDTRYEQERFDTLVSPAGAIAALERIELTLEPDARICSIDEAYPGHEQMVSKVGEVVSDASSPVLLLFSIVSYNAERTLSLIRSLRAEFGRRIVTIVGGQMVPYARRAYARNADIDVTCVGDAESVLPKLLTDLQSGKWRSEYEGWLSEETERPAFSTFSYKHYFKIRERMECQKRVAGFSQLVLQGPGGPGCSWAAFAGEPCNFCSLQNIAVMNRIPLDEHFESERALQEEYGPDRFFDVANQFIPVFGPSASTSVPWLEAFIRMRDRYGVTVPRYVYLTVSSVTEDVARLLKRAGVCEAFIGVDHFDSAALSEEGKPWRSKSQLQRCLDSLADNDIGFRVGIVLGAAKESRASLQAIVDGVDFLLSRYHPRALKMIGAYPVAIEPGSRIFASMQRRGLASEVFRAFEANGFLTKDQLDRLSQVYIQHHSDVSIEEIESVNRQVTKSITETITA